MWLGKSDLTDEHLVRTDDGVVYARSVRRLAENSWSEENLKAVVETPQKSMTTDDASDPRVVPEAHEQESPNEEANENDNESGETPDKPDDMDHEMEGETFPEPDTAVMSSSSRGEKRTETQENVFVKIRLMAKSVNDFRVPGLSHSVVKQNISEFKSLSKRSNVIFIEKHFNPTCIRIKSTTLSVTIRRR